MNGEQVTYEFLARHANQWLSTSDMLRGTGLHRFSEYIRRLRRKGHDITTVRHGKLSYYKLVSTGQAELNL